MTDPILYLSMILGLGGVYVLITSFNDDDDDSDDDGEKYLFNLEYAKAIR
jgi:putative Mn2+ efflux pump MntP